MRADVEYSCGNRLYQKMTGVAVDVISVREEMILSDESFCKYCAKLLGMVECVFVVMIDVLGWVLSKRGRLK